jgi:hypothetical protein
LKSAPQGDVKITILDENGLVVRTLTGSKKSGINRVWWNLRYEGPNQPKLRTKPPGNPLVWEEKRFERFSRQGWMPLMSWGIWGGLSGPLAVPGTYAVKLVVDGQEFSRKLNVKKDPHSAGSIADIQFQVQMALEIRDNTNTVVDSINRIEQIRKQIHDFAKSLKGDKSAVKVIAASKKLDEKIVEVEGKFFQKILAEGDLKSFRAPVKLYSQLALLAGDVAQGSADFPPTAQQIEVHEELKKELIAAQSKLKEFIQKDIAAFNTMLKKRNMPAIITKNF